MEHSGGSRIKKHKYNTNKIDCGNKLEGSVVFLDSVALIVVEKRHFSGTWEIEDFVYWSGSLDGFCWFIEYLQGSGIEKHKYSINKIAWKSEFKCTVVFLERVALVIVVEKAF